MDSVRYAVFGKIKTNNYSLVPKALAYISFKMILPKIFLHNLRLIMV